MAKETKSDRMFVSFILIGKDLNPNAISSSLGLSPSKSFKRGDMRTITEKWKHGYWEICSSDNVNSLELETHLRWITDQLMPVNQSLQKILNTQNVKAKISCFWIFRTSRGVFTLAPQLIRHLSELGIGIDFDIYGNR